MQLSMVGNRALVGIESVEALKWMALVLMLSEHTYRYVLGDLPLIAYLMGRLVFPLFVIALAVGMRGKTPEQVGRVVARMIPWAIFASATSLLVRDPLPMNVLWTFALGLIAHVFFRSALIDRRIAPAIGMVACLAVAALCEFGPMGVVAVMAGLNAANEKDERIAAVEWTLMAVLVCLWNRDPLALLALPVAWAIGRGGFQLPRVRGAFYWAYALQFPMFYLVKAVL